MLLQDYYTGEMRGIGFVEFADERTAEDAQRGLDRMFLEGREVRSAGPWHNACHMFPLSYVLDNGMHRAPGACQCDHEISELIARASGDHDAGVDFTRFITPDCCRLRCRSRWSSRSRAASGRMTTAQWARRHAVTTAVSICSPAPMCMHSAFMCVSHA